jgi:hypothetical protein
VSGPSTWLLCRVGVDLRVAGGRVVAKVLYLDIETSPNVADVWGLWNQNVGLAQLRQASKTIGFGYKWRHGAKAKWVGIYDRETGELDQYEDMLAKVHALLDEADIVVTYNGDGFDLKILQGEFAMAGMAPPSPCVSLDLFKIVKQNFRFPSKKLAYVADVLIGDTKVQNGGHVLWRRCLDPDVEPEVRRKAWALMSRYCRQDVDLLEPLHEKLEPWVPAKVNMALIGGPREEAGCGKCGAEADELERRGFAYTATRAYQRFRCRACGGWSRGSKMEWSAAGGAA